MDMHHLHGLMSHGLEMALEGATLQMLGQMNMAGAIDKTAVDHGTAMMSEGRGLINSAIAGPSATSVRRSGYVSGPISSPASSLSTQSPPAGSAAHRRDRDLHLNYTSVISAPPAVEDPASSPRSVRSSRQPLRPLRRPPPDGRRLSHTTPGRCSLGPQHRRLVGRHGGQTEECGDRRNPPEDQSLEHHDREQRSPEQGHQDAHQHHQRLCDSRH